MKAVWKYFGVVALALAIVFGASYAQEKSKAPKENLAAFFIKSNEQVITLLQAPKAESSAKVDGTIRKLRAANEKLKKIEAQMRDPKQAKRYGTLLVEAIEVQGAINNDVDGAMSYSYPSYVTMPIEGMVPIEDLPVNPPISPSNPGDCEQAGDAVRNDCMIASQMLENCGAIDMGEKVMMQFSCGTAGQTEEMACNQAIGANRPFTPREPNQSLAAEITCRALEQQRGVGDELETQTSTGN